MTVQRRGTKVPHKLDTLTIKAGVLAGATYPMQLLKNATTGKMSVDPRGGKPVAMFAMMLEYGGGRIPPRPFMQLTVAKERTTWVELLVKLVRAGQSEQNAARFVGQVMQEDIQSTINNWPADNAQSTIEKKGFNHGLIESSHLLKSISNAVLIGDEL